VEVSKPQAEAIARAVGLDLPPERVEALVRQLSEFMTAFESIRAIDKGEREPSTITWKLGA